MKIKHPIYALAGALLFSVLVGSVSAATPKTYYAFVFTAPNPGQEAEYNRWYNEEHAPDVVSIPGFVSAQRFARSSVQLRPKAASIPPYLVIYKIVTDDLASVYAEVSRRAASGQTRMSPTMARSGAMNITYRLTTPEKIIGNAGNSTKADPAQTYYHIVLSDSNPGEESALDRWYLEAHGPDMNKLPGSAGYWFGELASVQMTPDTQYPRHLSVFHFQTTDIGTAANAFGRTVEKMTPGPAMLNVWGYTYQAIGPELCGDKIRAQRAAESAAKGTPP